MLSDKLPRPSFLSSSACATFVPVIERLASNATHSRVNWSTTVRMRNERPSANLSLTKSMLQHWFGRTARPVGTGRRRAILRRCWVRTIILSSGTKRRQGCSLRCYRCSSFLIPHNGEIPTHERSPTAQLANHNLDCALVTQPKGMKKCLPCRLFRV